LAHRLKLGQVFLEVGVRVETGSCLLDAGPVLEADDADPLTETFTRVDLRGGDRLCAIFQIGFLGNP
jgi:hypothetical protein